MSLKFIEKTAPYSYHKTLVMTIRHATQTMTGARRAETRANFNDRKLRPIENWSDTLVAANMRGNYPFVSQTRFVLMDF